MPEGLKCTITITDQAVTIEWDPFLPDGPHEVTKDRAPGRRHRVRHEPGAYRQRQNAPDSLFLRISNAPAKEVPMRIGEDLLLLSDPNEPAGPSTAECPSP